MWKSVSLAVIAFCLCVSLGRAALAETSPQGPEQDGTPDMVVILTLEQHTAAVSTAESPLSPATRITVRPGDTYLYYLACENVGSGPAQDFRVTVPLAEGEEYLSGTASADSAKVSFSIDGGTTFHRPPLTYLARLPDGGTEKRVAPTSMYTTIRWLFAGMILPGEKRTASFTVRQE